MCDEYENELVRMGLVEDARKFRAERHAEEHEDGRQGQSDQQGSKREIGISLKEIAPKWRVY